jgi:hypothetical protein
MADSRKILSRLNRATKAHQAIKIGAGGIAASSGLCTMLVALELIRELTKGGGPALRHALSLVFIMPWAITTAAAGGLATFSGAHVAHSGIVRKPSRPLETIVTAVTVSIAGIFGGEYLKERLQDKVSERRKHIENNKANYFEEYYQQYGKAPGP